MCSHEKIMVCDGEEKRTTTEELPQGNFQEVHLKQTNSQPTKNSFLKSCSYWTSGTKEFRVGMLFPNKLNVRRKNPMSQNFYISKRKILIEVK